MNVLLAKISITCWILSILCSVVISSNILNNLPLKSLDILLQTFAVVTSIYPVFDVASGKYIEKKD